MGRATAPEMTELLHAWRDGDAEAGRQLMEAAYADLRRIASRLMRAEREGHTLEPPALVNELYLKLGKGGDVDWQDRRHFFTLAAGIMRRLLIDHARGRNAARRRGVRVTLPVDLVQDDTRHVDVVLLDRALTRMEALYPRESRVVELRYFCGMTVEEVALSLGVATGTVKRDWRFARGWLRLELGLE